MNINEAIQLVRFILNKDQNGNITGDNFNLMAPVAQMSVLQDRLGNIKKYQPGSPVPNYGFSVSQKAREELMPLMVKPTTTAVAAGLAAYPGKLSVLQHPGNGCRKVDHRGHAGRDC
jgi:hypothetical protein